MTWRWSGKPIPPDIDDPILRLFMRVFQLAGEPITREEAERGVVALIDFFGSVEAAVAAVEEGRVAMSISVAEIGKAPE